MANEKDILLTIQWIICKIYYYLDKWALRGPFEPLHQLDFACLLSIYRI